MITAKTVIVQMSHNQLNMSWVRFVSCTRNRMHCWSPIPCGQAQLHDSSRCAGVQIWVLLAALGTVAVMLSKRGDNTEHPDVIAEEEQSADEVAEEDVTDRDAVPRLENEGFSPDADIMHLPAARTRSAPLSDLCVRTCCDSASFQQLQRFWARSGPRPPVVTRSGPDAAQAVADSKSHLQRRPVSLDSRPRTVLAPPQSEDASCRAASESLLDQDLQPLSSFGDDDSDARSWPSTPHTPDLKAALSSDLASLGEDSSFGQRSGDSATGGVQVPGPPQPGGSGESTVSKPAPSLLRTRQCEPEEHDSFNDGQRTLGGASMLLEDAHEVDEASEESDAMDSCHSFSCTSSLTGGASRTEHCLELGNAAVARRDGESVLPETVLDGALSGGSAAISDISLPWGCPEGLNEQHLPSAGSAVQLPTAQLGSSGEGTGNENGIADSHAMLANVDAAVGSDGAAGAACKPPVTDHHVQVSSELNLRSLPVGMTLIPRPNPLSCDCGASLRPAVASPLQGVMSGHSLVRGGLDSTSSTVFPQNSWQIPDDVEVQQSKLPPRPASVFSSDASSDVGPTHPPDAGPPRHQSGQSNGSMESYGSSGSPSFMSFPTEQNHIHILHWT